MSKIFSFGFWNTIARIILRNRVIILGLIIAFTVFLGFQWKNMRFSYTEANLLPDDHEVNQEYKKFLDKFFVQAAAALPPLPSPTCLAPSAPCPPLHDSPSTLPPVQGQHLPNY